MSCWQHSTELKPIAGSHNETRKVVAPVALISLPIDSHLNEICQSLGRSNCLILEAPPGTGKTTRVAPSLLDLRETPRSIALIQPRRVAARAVAMRIARERETRLGGLVGYQVRFDSSIGSATRLISMTPGILLRRIHSDPLLEEFSAVVLDEFHERSQEIDLVLGMVRQLQRALRSELRIVVMSATLGAASEIARYLDTASVLQIAGQNYPVDVRHSRFEASNRLGQVRRIVQLTVEAVVAAIEIPEGDILVFLPGVGEIMQVRKELEHLAEKRGIELMTLFGDMPAEEQDRVLSPGSRRRIILSTNIAETSLTIEGVRVVVDSGWARIKRFDPATGLDALRLEPISQASATQRTGRAGRTAPGVCFRLWDEITGRSRAAQLEPEVLRTDLASPVLQLLNWNELPEEFPWLTPPSPQAIAQARQVLEYLGAIQEGHSTELGALMLKFPMHPRLARLLIEAHRLGIPSMGAAAAAMLSERDLFLRPDRNSSIERLSRSSLVSNSRSGHARDWPCDLTHRVQIWFQFLRDRNPETPLGTINQSASRNLSRVSQQYLDIVKAELGQVTDERVTTHLQQALLKAFPDRLAKRRNATGPRALLVGGKGGQLESDSGVRSELFLCLDVDAGCTEAKVRIASGIQPEWLDESWLRVTDERFFNPTQQAVTTRRRTYWIDLVLNEQPVATPLDEQTASMLAQEAAKQFDRLLPAKDKHLHSTLARIRWLAESMPEAGLPKMDPEWLAHVLTDWCVDRRSIAEVKQLPWKSLIDGLLTAEQKRQLDQQAPESMTLPSGRTVLLDYEPGRAPVLAARIQELFGWANTPKLAGGRVPLTLHLLAPNQRIQQITDDLASFWKNTYPKVRKDLRGRYPKHDWPEVPPAAKS